MEFYAQSFCTSIWNLQQYENENGGHEDKKQISRAKQNNAKLYDDYLLTLRYQLHKGLFKV